MSSANTRRGGPSLKQVCRKRESTSNATSLSIVPMLISIEARESRLREIATLAFSHRATLREKYYEREPDLSFDDRVCVSTNFTARNWPPKNPPRKHLAHPHLPELLLLLLIHFRNHFLVPRNTLPGAGPEGEGHCWTHSTTALCNRKRTNGDGQYRRNFKAKAIP